jgi:hypothetical protein
MRVFLLGVVALGRRFKEKRAQPGLSIAKSELRLLPEVGKSKNKYVSKSGVFKFVGF